MHVPALTELLDWCADPAAAQRFSAHSNEPWLVLSPGSQDLPAADAERIGAWLMELPCPILGITQEDHDDPVTRACDVLVADEKSAQVLTANVERNPIAAGVLVQTLRATAELPIPHALHLESLAYATLQAGAEFRRWLAGHKAESPAVPSDTGPAVLVSRDDDELRLVLNRASNRNAINVEMRDVLVEALQLAITDTSVESIHISGLGKCFSVGGDLTEFGTFSDPAAAHAIRSVAMPGRFIAACADRVECHVHGACIGSGVELPAFARRVTAEADTFFHLPELGFGLIPGGGGCVSIPRRIGRQRTAWLVLSCKRINAKTALEWGLVDEIV